LVDCKKINLKKGNKGSTVKEVQTILQQLGYYKGKLDGDFGSMTDTAVKNYQKHNKLVVDGIVGPITCKKLNSTTKKNKVTEEVVYTEKSYCEKQGGDCLGQITGYHCACHCIKQILRTFGITKYNEKTIGTYAGTTTKGTSHQGINTAIAKIARLEGINLKVEWKNFSSLGSTQKERFKKLGEIIQDEKKAVITHVLYKEKYGHYEVIKTINTNKSNLVIPNSLGSKCKSPAYCGYLETRSYTTENKYLNGISQPSICIITKE
jgi:hypothetical protein